MYWIVLAKKESVYEGDISPVISEPVLLFIAAVSAVNPVIYTIASKPFLAGVVSVVSALVVSRNNRIMTAPAGQFAEQDDSSCCGPCCTLRRWRPYVQLRIPETLTEETDDTCLFTEESE